MNTMACPKHQMLSLHIVRITGTVDLQTFIHVLPVQKSKESMPARKCTLQGEMFALCQTRQSVPCSVVKPGRLKISVGYSLNQDYFKTLPLKIHH